MEREDRKAAISAYKKREDAVGIYAVRCIASGQAWVGRALNLDAIQNRLWFTLDHGSCTAKSLQAAWREHGPASLTFEVLERLEPEETAYIRDAILKERLAHWRATLGAEAV
ncbi:GIY-YIG nuclease family protein [Kaistia terrae]|uniref:GIY-YIG nuclease family protein n=1 Tax=Kaistia terrae TaxID=537017 RepID=A0ABW0PQ87_9HYPH|nr:GIY-YIG nuclease family protein [Kaistia terrae]MCX5578036.1 GIY-YIG nuclease family protein [Kaistia terrae]